MRIFLIAFCVLSSFDSYGYQNAGVLEIYQKSTLKKTNYLPDTVLSTASAKFSILFMRIFLIAFCVLSSFDSYGYQNAGVLEIYQKSTLKKTNYLPDTVLS